jgi:hypothetical protein
MSSNLGSTIDVNNALSILERMPLAELPAHSVQCATCLLVHSKSDLKGDGCVCGECGDMICLTCGCTDSLACDEGCAWVGPGQCSSHEGAR